MFTTTLLSDGTWVALIADASFKGAALFAVATLVAFLLRHSSAAVRHRLWALAFCGVFVIPVISSVMPQWKVPILRPEPSAAKLKLSSSAEETGRTAEAPVVARHAEPDGPDRAATAQDRSRVGFHSEMNSPVGAQTEGTKDNDNGKSLAMTGWVTLEALLILVWAVGVAVAFVPLLRSAVFKQRILAKARPLQDAEWNALLHEICVALGSKRSVRLFESPDENVPVTWGIFRPLIVLPALSSEWTPQRRRFVLLHELAHIERLDLPFQILSRVVCALHWFNPLLWHAYSRLRIECEHACDDCVVHHGARASDYAAELVYVAKTFSARPILTAVGMARTSQLESRVRSLFERTRSHLPLSRRGKLGSLAVAALLTVAAASIHPVGRDVAADEPLAPAAAKPASETSQPRSAQGPSRTEENAESKVADDPLPPGARARLGSTRWRHQSEVARARFSPDGKILATAGDVDTIRLWDVATGRQLHALTDTGRWNIYGLVFSPNGKHLASIQQGGVLRLWDVQTGKQVCEPQTHAGVPFGYERYGIARSADGTTIATIGPKSLRTWEAATLKPLKELPVGPVKDHGERDVAFSPDGRLLAAAVGPDIQLWNAQTGQLQMTIPAVHADGVTALVFTPDSRTLISGGLRKGEQIRIGNQVHFSTAEIAIWDVATGKRETNLTAKAGDSGLYSLALSADGKVLVSGHHSEARVWSLERRELIRTISDQYAVEGGYPCVPALSQDGKWLAACTSRHAVGLWNVETGELSENSRTHRGAVNFVAPARVGTLLVTGSNRNGSSNGDPIRLWDLSSGEELRQVLGQNRNGFSTIAVSPDHSTIAAGGGSRLAAGPGNQLDFIGTVAIGGLDPSTPVVEAKFAEVIGLLAYSPDGLALAAATNNRPVPMIPKKEEAVLILNPTDGTLRQRLSDKEAAATCAMAFSPDRKVLYAVGNDNKLRHWDIDAAKVTQAFVIAGHERWPVHHAAFSRDARRVATCGLFGTTLIVTNVATGQRVCELSAPETLGSRMAFSPDGRLLASACQAITNTDTRFDERIHLWDIETGRKLHSFDGATDGYVESLSFLPNGRTLVSGMGRGTVLLWDMPRLAE